MTLSPPVSLLRAAAAQPAPSTVANAAKTPHANHITDATYTTEPMSPGGTAAPAATAATTTPTDNRGIALRQMLRPIAHYLADAHVREITVPRPGVIFLRVGGAWHEKPAPELTFPYLQALVAAMASYNEGVRFEPIMSLQLLDGERGQVMLPPAVLEGTISLNIRKHSSVVKTLDELARDGAFAQWRDVSGDIQAPHALGEDDRALLALKQQGDMPGFLDLAVRRRKNIIIGGKTGSGKTTFARSLIERVPTDERLITIEDVHELYLPRHPNKVHLLYGTGQGQTSASECVAACMRSSPDRIFLSELRGPEAWDYLTALNTGHPGSVTTTHANSARDCFHRVALLIKQSGAGQQIDVQTLRDFLLGTLDIALYFSAFKLVEVYFNPEKTHTFV